MDGRQRFKNIYIYLVWKIWSDDDVFYFVYDRENVAFFQTIFVENQSTKQHKKVNGLYCFKNML